MFRNRSVDVHQFAMVPRAEIPRARFDMEFAYKTTFDAGYLIPILCEEVLPGDSWSLSATMFARLSTPIVPFMHNMYLESFFFFVPNRLTWQNWVRFMGEQYNPGDSISYNIPQTVSPAGGFLAFSIFDYLGLPCAGQVTGANTTSVNCLPMRAYGLIYYHWFRDENLVSAYSGYAGPPPGDGPDPYTNFPIMRRGKRHDYFTSCLPFVQKGTAVSIPLTGNATVKTNATALVTGAHTGVDWLLGTGAAPNAGNLVASIASGIGSGGVFTGPNTTAAGTSAPASGTYPTNLYADLSTATATTINALRLAFQTQKLLERDARGGTRYTEIVRSHFGVLSPDARLQRPEYLGGGSTPIYLTPVPQTTATGLTGGTTPQGNLSAFGTTLAQNHGFSQSFTEHGYIIGIVNVRADLVYQQGMRKHWSRLTRYDYYFPVFAMLGEQAVLNKELYCDGSANDVLTFGYQERWAEYRYGQSQITGAFRSTFSTPLDMWHLAQKFTTLPTLNQTFIEETPPVTRVLAVTTANENFLFDAFFKARVSRPMPMFSVPGLIDHF